MKPSLSIAMCTYNGSRFLPEQLSTIALQTRLPDEVVICDDASSDGSAELIAEFSKRVSFPIRLIVNKEKLGSTKNFEKAIGHTEGEVVALADQDDAWYPHKLARVEKEFLSSSDIVAVFSDADVMNDRSAPSALRLWRSFAFSGAEQVRFANGHALNVLIKHPIVTGAAMAFRRRFFEFLAPIPAEDVHDRWMSFLLACCGQIALIAEPMMRYRRHDAQQIGVGAMTLGERLRRSRTTGTDVYLAEITRFRRLQSRLEEFRARFPLAEKAREEITRKIAHLEHRIKLREMSGSRLPRILREIRNHGYWDYSAGWESVAKDLFLCGHASL